MRGSVMGLSDPTALKELVEGAPDRCREPGHCAPIGHGLTPGAARSVTARATGEQGIGAGEVAYRVSYS
jgi:hypothetical protein